MLKTIRAYVAEKYGLAYAATECNHQGDCPGTCPKCDAELADLQRQLVEHGITEITQDKTLSDMVENYINTLRQDKNEQQPLGGIPEPLDKIFRIEGMPAPTVPMEGDISLSPITPEPEYERKVILNAIIAAMLDMGWQEMLEAEITELKDHVPYSDKMHIAVYVRSKEPIRPKDDRLHILDFDDQDWEAFTEELWQKGYTYRRWGQCLPDVTDLPKEGDMVVFIHPEDDQSVLYLMKVVAEGDEQVRPILTHGEDLNELVDDCCPYVLTALKGPMTFTSDELSFLGTPWKGHCRPDFKMEKEVSDKWLTLLQGK